MALDLTPGRCHRREGKLCAIHAERPLACQTVPFHYSRVEPFPLAEFDAFVSTPGHACDSGPQAPLALEAGRVAAPDYAAARTLAAAQMVADKPWRAALAAAIAASHPALPGRRVIEANAARGASAVPMIAAWRIAAEAGVIAADALAEATARQLALVKAELARAVRNGNAAQAEELRGLALGLAAPAA